VEVFDADYFETLDTSRTIRIGIKFFFKRIGVYVPKVTDIIDQSSIVDPFIKYEILPQERTVPPNVTERTGLLTTRVGQGAYRKSIIHRWEYKCAVTGFNKLDILIASHIVPWCDSNDNERLDVDNGLLLSPTYDALFDRHLISFEKDGKIILSDAVDYSAYKKIGVTGKERISNLSINNYSYLDRHRIHINDSL
jgi:5-methylcytosine-specific restriction enzyme A